MKTYSFSGLRVLKTRVDEGKFHTFIEREPFNFKPGALLYLGLIWPKPLFAAEQGMGFGVLILNKVCYNCHFTRFSVLNTVFVFWTRIVEESVNFWRVAQSTIQVVTQRSFPQTAVVVLCLQVWFKHFLKNIICSCQLY